jgi:2-methylcitrate dehydratase PrpD
VTVAFADGRVVSQTINAPKGDPENPVSEQELEAKFRQMLEGTHYRADAWLGFVRRLEAAETMEMPEN